MSRRALVLLVSGLIVAASSSSLPAQSSPNVSPSLFSEMKWRAIGPNRGGRTKAAAGHASQPYTFYIGVCNGGVWKTTDAGRTWTPIFDDQETGSIGSVVVAPSDPNIIYVGSGEGLARPDLSVGDGVFKSTDAGKTWTHLPQLRDAQQIPNIAVDPKNPDRVFVAVFGHPYGPSKERGIYRSLDGGKTFQAVLQVSEDVGGNDVDIDPLDPNIVFATMWEERQGPWENAQWRGTGGGIYRSSDGGTTWKKVMPDITQANLAIAPSNPRRIYAAVANGAGTSFMLSNDGGDTWAAANNRGVGRIGGGDLSVPVVNPKDQDMVFTANTVSYKTTDAGKTWVPFKGAPGGDDYQNLWVNPNDPNIILLVSDQGAVVTLNGGQNWSSWYNQPTAQLYHVNADNDFPYRVCSGQQESGSACVSSRGNDGQITFREWHPANGTVEYGYAVPDPTNPNIVYGSGVTRYDRTTGQFSSIGPGGGRGGGGGGGRGGGAGGPAGPAQRTTRTVPLAISEADHALYFGGGQVWKTVNGGRDWTSISPNFTRKTWDPPKSIGKYATTSPPPAQLAAVYAIAPSPLSPLRLWVGTDDGMIQTTADGGKTWNDVTPPTMTPFMKVFNMDAGHFDALTAYAAGNTLRTDDMRPHLFRTHDGGKTWTEINTGLENAGPTSTIREDPVKKGLLFAGSERHVYVSFDDGDHWQTLKLNMASSSVRDLTIHEDDLIAATHGRGFWILDDITPLRQIAAASANEAAILFKPTTALRVRWNTNSDTPLPPDESNLKNPPEGAIIDYYLKSPASLVTLEVLTSDGRLVRHYSSADPVAPLPDPTASSLPLYWYRPPQGLSAAAGMHRFTWDVHLQPLAGGGGGGRGGGGALPIAAVPYNTVPTPTTPWANPGTYAVKLTVDGKSYTQPIVVKQDPRVRTAALIMQDVYAQTYAAYFGAIDAQDAARQAQGLRDQIAAISPKPTGAVADALAAFDKKVQALIGAAPAAAGGGGRGGGAGAPGAGAGRGGGARGGGAAGGGAAGAAQAGPPTQAPPTPPSAPAAPAAPAPPAAPTLSGASSALSGVMSSFQAADVEPTTNQKTAVAAARSTAAAAMALWNTVKTVDLPALNLKLKAAGIGALKIQ